MSRHTAVVAQAGPSKNRGQDSTSADADEAMHPGANAAVIRARAKTAVAEGWLQLVEDLLQEVDEAFWEKPSKDAYKARAPEDENEPMPAAIAQSATVRARTGSLKGAVSILTGSPPVPPGQRADELIAALYKTEQRSEEDEELFRGELDAIRKSLCTARVRLSPKQASAQVRRIRPAAGAGPSV